MIKVENCAAHEPSVVASPLPFSKREKGSGRQLLMAHGLAHGVKLRTAISAFLLILVIDREYIHIIFLL